MEEGRYLIEKRESLIKQILSRIEALEDFWLEDTLDLFIEDIDTNDAENSTEVLLTVALFREAECYSETSSGLILEVFRKLTDLINRVVAQNYLLDPIYAMLLSGLITTLGKLERKASKRWCEVPTGTSKNFRVIRPRQETKELILETVQLWARYVFVEEFRSLRKEIEEWKKLLTTTSRSSKE